MSDHKIRPLFSQKKSKRPWFVGISLLLILFVILLLPYIGSYRIRQNIHQFFLDQAVQDVVIGKVGINIFTGRVVVEDLSVTSNDREVVHVGQLSSKVSWLALLRQRWSISELESKGVRLLVEQSQPEEFQIGGYTISTATQSLSSKLPGWWGVGIERAALTDVQIIYQGFDTDVDLALDEFILSDLQSWNPNQNGEISVLGHINGAALELQANLKPDVVSLELTGHVKLAKFPLSSVNKLVEEVGVVNSGQLSFDTDFKVSVVAKSDYTISQKGKIDVVGFALEQIDFSTSYDNLNWDGRITLNLPANASSTIQATGQLISDNFELTDKVKALTARHSHAQLNTRLNWQQLKDEGGKFNLSGNAALQDVRVDDINKGLRLLSLKSIELGGINFLNKDDIGVETMSVDSLAIGQRLADKETNDAVVLPLLSSAEIHVNTVHLRDGQALSINSVDLVSLMANLHRSQKSDWGIANEFLSIRDAFPASDSDKSSSKGAANEGNNNEDKKGIQITRIGLFGISQLIFRDNKVSPPFMTKVDIAGTTISNIDSRNPSQSSMLDFTGHVDDNTKLVFSGSFEPFADSMTVKGEGLVSSLELPQLSPYVLSTMGYAISKGNLNAKLNLDVNNGRLGGETGLRLTNLRIARANEKKATLFEQNLGISFESALSLLGDKKLGDKKLTDKKLANQNHNIKFKVPIEGNARFSFGNTLQQLLTKAIREASIASLKSTLRPYGANVVALKIENKTVSVVQFDPIKFEPGETKLSLTAKQQLELIAKLLREREGVHTRICGVSVYDDVLVVNGKAANRRKNPDLVQQRSDNVKSYLISQFFINPNRLSVCIDEIDDEKSAKPRVLIRF